MAPFTVLIPTLNRCGTLAHTLESCIVQQDENFRVVVSDNHSTDDTREVVESFRQRDPRVEYIQPPTRLSMARNFEFCVERVQDGFLMFLGSDDGLLPGAMPRARDCLSRHPEARALHASPCAAFFYPELTTDDAGLLYLRVDPMEEVRSSHEWLEKIASSERNVTQLPMPYQLSWVHVDVLQRIRAISGKAIHSPIPDLFLGIASAAQSESYVSVNPGFGIGAVSAGSNGSGTLHPKGDRKLEDVFVKQNEIPFHAKVGYTRSVPILVCECLLQAGDAGLLPSGLKIDWERFIARAWHQFASESWSEPEMKSNLESLRFFSSHVGGGHVLDGASGASTPQELVERYPFLVESKDGEWEAVFDTRPLQMKGVHEAARLAESMMQAALRGNGVKALGSTGDLANWIVLQQARLAASLQKQLRSVRHESNRRAAERNRAKSLLASAREKQEHLRKKLA